jgi:hypothetical protein
MYNSLVIFCLFCAQISFAQVNTVIDDSNCMDPIGIISKTIEFCDTAPSSIEYCNLTWMNLPDNPADSIQLWWEMPGISPWSEMYAPHLFDPSGCYQFNLTLICSGTADTAVLSSTWYVSTLGIENAFLQKEKQYIRTTDFLGRELINPTKGLVIRYYTDGSSQSVFLTE